MVLLCGASHPAAARRLSAATLYVWRMAMLTLNITFFHCAFPPAAACRLAAATPAELRSSSHLAHCGEPISLFSEQLALRSLQAACKAQLAALPTALAEDEALLSSMTDAAAAAGVDAEEGMPAKAATQAAATGDRQQQEAECLELAVMWRLCYKRALVGCVQLCQTALAALAGSADGGVQ
jgi:hypothetical protein